MQWTVVGHEPQKELFARLLEEQSLAHAYLLHGPDGIGKRAFARELATVLLAHEVLPISNNPDFLELATGVNKDTGKRTDISVEAARKMREWAYTRPLYGAYKVVVIDDADWLGGEAATTLLKLIEEPPAYFKCFLITSQLHGVLPTIMSRCQLASFGLLASDEFTSVMASTKLKADERELLALIMPGRPGAALKLVEEGRLKEATQAIASLQKVVQGSVAEKIGLAKEIAESDDPMQVASWWLAYVHSRLPQKPQIASVAKGLLELYETLSNSSFNRRLALEKFFLSIPRQS